MGARDELHRFLIAVDIERYEPRERAPEADDDDDVPLDDEMLTEVDAAARRVMALRHRLRMSLTDEHEQEREDAGCRESILAKAAEVAASGGETFWARLHEADRVELLSMSTAREFAAREILFHAGDVAGSVFIVAEGWVRIVTPSLAGHEGTTVALRGPGEVVGEGGALCGIPRSATVQALGGGMRALEIPAELFSAFLEANPPAARLVERIITQRLRDANELSRIITMTSREQRLAAVVGKLAERHREIHPPPMGASAGKPAEEAAEEMPISLPIAAMDLASMAALPLGSVEDITRKWKRCGILRPDGVGIALLSLSALREIRSGPVGDSRRPPVRTRENRAVRAWEKFQQLQADILEELERMPEHSAPGSSG
jgi:CRP-like cAMP-binding protein